ncbi:MAG: hypothetical protein IT462_00465 [Planctomycetes bacterium]|nr:hypothetical protein [Planctomycetota bacterium]
MTANRDNRSLVRWLPLLALLLLLFGGGAWFVTHPPVRPTPRYDSANEELADRPAPVNRPERAVKPLKPKPAPQPAQPEAKAEEPVEPPYDLTLPPMSRFRRLVLEADGAIRLQEFADTYAAAQREELRRVDATLDRLKSPYSTYSAVRLKREFTTDEKQELASGIAADFRNPDVDTKSFKVEAGRRIAVWLREGVKLPKEENPNSGEDSIPLTRRVHEKITPAALDSVLDAIEREYGESQVGTGKDAQPLDFVLFPDRATITEFGDKRLNIGVPAWSAGFYAPSWDLVCAPVLAHVCLAEVLRHELFHAYQGRVAPKSIYCPWFSEGTAEWLDKAPPKNGKLVTHEAFRYAACGYLLSLLDAGVPLDLAAFLSLSIEKFYMRPDINYLMAYCFVDFLRNTPDLQRVYYDFWKAMKEGREVADAHKGTFGKLDMPTLEKRFLEYLRKFRARHTPVRFTIDSPPHHGRGSLPLSPLPTVTKPVDKKNPKGEWGEVMVKLADAGFIYTGPPLESATYDRVIIAIDSSASMQGRVNWNSFDQAAFTRWATALTLMPRLKLTREGTAETVPASMLAMLVEAVLTKKTDEFSTLTGIKIDSMLVRDIEIEHKGTSKDLDRQARNYRDLSAWVSRKLAALWCKDEVEVRVVDFNYNVESGSTEGDYPDAINSLFNSLASNAGAANMHGADTDWLKALQEVLNPELLGGASTAVIFFTDGPNSAGALGHNENNRDNKRYASDMALLAKQVGDMFKTSGLSAENTLFQFFALPGAQDQSLDLVADALPDGKVDEWAYRFPVKRK